MSVVLGDGFIMTSLYSAVCCWYKYVLMNVQREIADVSFVLIVQLK